MAKAIRFLGKKGIFLKGLLKTLVVKKEDFLIFLDHA